MTGPRRKLPSSAGLAESVRTGRRSAAARAQEAGVALRSLQFAITCATCLRRALLDCVLALLASSVTLGPLREAKATTSLFNSHVIMSRECPSHGRPQRSEDGRLGGAGRAQAIGRARNRVGSTRLQRVIDAMTGPVEYRHDAFGNLAAATYADGHVDLRMPDAVGNLFRTHDRTDRKYGPAGQLLEARDARGVTRYEYDSTIAMAM